MGDGNQATWSGIFAPGGTPRERVARLNGDFIKVLQRPDMKERFLKQGAEVATSTPEEFAAFISRETRVFAGIISSAGIQAE